MSTNLPGRILIEVTSSTDVVLDLSHGSAVEIATFTPPAADWANASQDHFAQFYDTEAFLLESLSSFVRNGLKAGEAVVVVATEGHRNCLQAILETQGVDIAAAQADGLYQAFDAAELLAQLLEAGAVSKERLETVVGKVIGEASGKGRPVRVFGEMVALLWAEQKYEEAIRLEALWNELRRTQAFLLFCAYPMGGFGHDSMAAPLTDVCMQHSAVIPAESFSSAQNHDQRLRAVIALQQKAKSLIAEIAERKRVEDELRASLSREQIARAEAEAANRMKDEFLATVSHELRTPLNAIIGWSHMLRSGKLDSGAVTRAVETIDRNAKAQAQLVEDILDVSRMITGKLRLDMEPVDVASVINAAIDAVQLAAESKEIHLKVTLDPSARHTFGDSGRLQQVVWNLLSNAIKFTPAGGKVELRLERTDSSIELRIVDTGQGITPEFLPFVFDRFRQGDASSTRKIGGLGLGLAIVRHITELHGGTVRAESDGKGCGSTFIITLPHAGASERAKYRRSATGTLRPIVEASPAAFEIPSLDQLRVLLVDDDRDTLQVLSVCLTDAKANVQTAASVAEALEIIKWFRPQVLVSDLAMPDEDGYSLIAKVRGLEDEDLRGVATLALTSFVRVEDRTRALSAGFDMFVPKPVQPNELIVTIANVTK
jgi:signal transduction histidine kinase/ActR/RegA family two-component response regulator